MKAVYLVSRLRTHYTKACAAGYTQNEDARAELYENHRAQFDRFCNIVIWMQQYVADHSGTLPRGVAEFEGPLRWFRAMTERVNAVPSERLRTERAGFNVAVERFIRAKVTFGNQPRHMEPIITISPATRNIKFQQLARINAGQQADSWSNMPLVARGHLLFDERAPAHRGRKSKSANALHLPPPPAPPAPSSATS